MVVTKYSTEEINKLYPRATTDFESKCDLSATCSTCMYAWLPKDYDEVGDYGCYCGRHEKGETK